MSLTPLTPERQHDLDHQVESPDCIEPLGDNQSAHNPNHGNPNHRLQSGPHLFWPTQTTDLQTSPPQVSILNQGPLGPLIPQGYGPPTGPLQRGQPSPDSTQGPDAIQNHIETVHAGKKPHGCNICGKSFTSDQNLTLHLDVRHEGKNNQQFNVSEPQIQCKVQIPNQSLSVHDEKKPLKSKSQKPYKCLICGFAYSSKQYLKIHIKKKHGLSASKEKTLHPMPSEGRILPHERALFQRGQSMPSGGHQMPPGVYPSSNGCHSMPHEVHPIHEVKTEIFDGFSIEEQRALEIVEDLPMPKHHGGQTMLDGGREMTLGGQQVPHEVHSIHEGHPKHHGGAMTMPVGGRSIHDEVHLINRSQQISNGVHQMPGGVHPTPNGFHPIHEGSVDYPLDYKLIKISLDNKPDYSKLIAKRQIPVSGIQLDPRLRRYAGGQQMQHGGQQILHGDSQNFHCYIKRILDENTAMRRRILDENTAVRRKITNLQFTGRKDQEIRNYAKERLRKNLRFLAWLGEPKSFPDSQPDNQAKYE